MSTRTGTSDNEIIDGSNGNDTIDGGGGNDTINAGQGVDWIDGGTGTDIVSLDRSYLTTAVTLDTAATATAAGQNLSDGSHIQNVEQLGSLATGSGNDTLRISSPQGPFSWDGGAGTDSLAWLDIQTVKANLVYDAAAAATAAGTTLADGSHIQNVERLGELITGSGDDTLIVSAANGPFFWSANGGIDTLVANFANLTQGVDVEREDPIGADNRNFHIFTGSSEIGTADNVDVVHFTGGAGDDTLVGVAFNDTLAGGAGNDHLDGDTGNDYLDGASGNNTLIGGAGDDTLMGHDGVQLMQGGAGNDVYYIDNAADVISESTTPGTDDGGLDTVHTSVSYTLGAFVENMWLSDAGGNIDATGNASNNTLWGNGGNNLLSGLDGNDSLLGGGGNDTLIGGAGNDYLDGGSGSNRLAGGAGNDTLMAGTGPDSFVFAAAGTANGIDRVYGYVHGTDELLFAGTDYGLAPGHALTATQFTVGTQVSRSSAQFVWNATTHTLYWDHDGAGGDAAVAIAIFQPSVTIDAGDLHFS